ncbi:MAG: response regulator [Gemmatimonadetes bacterium]|nr:response regulator [Gemmatimonadota bacterium]
MTAPKPGVEPWGPSRGATAPGWPSGVRPIIIGVVVLYATVYSLALLLRLGVDTWVFENTAFLPLYALAGVGALVGASQGGLSARQRLGWRLIGIGWIASCLGAWAYLAPAAPSVDVIDDVLYRSYYPLVMLGFLLLVDAEALRDAPARALLELAIIGVAALTLSWYFVWGLTERSAGSASASTFDDIGALGEVAVLVAAGTALIAPGRGDSRRRVEWLGAGALCASVGDLMLVRASLDTSITLRQVGSVLVAVSAALFAIAGMIPRRPPLEEARTPASLLPYASLAVIGLIVVREALLGPSPSRALGGLLIGAVLLTTLVIARVVLAESDARRRAHLLEAATEVRIELERQLRHRQRLDALGLLAGGVAHDFNNVLQAVRSHAELALLNAPTAAQGDLRQIVQATARGAALCRQLLLFGRPLPGERVRFVLSDAITGIFPMLRRVVPSTIEIDVIDQAPTATVLAERAQVEVAILNLVMNARDAIPAEGRVTLELATAMPPEGNGDAGVQLTVRDTGCGMSAETMSRAVEPFFTTKGGQGTGLGLSTAFGTMRALGGDLTMRSSEGVGTAVTLTFPPAPGAPATPPATVSCPAVPRDGVRVLVVDDEPSVRTAMQRGLALLGYDVQVACDGLEALEYLQADPRRVDALLSDVNMPRLSGVTLATRLREEGATLPIILMTGNAASVSEGSGLPEGVLLLSKPFDLEELAGLLDRLLVR